MHLDSPLSPPQPVSSAPRASLPLEEVSSVLRSPPLPSVNLLLQRHPPSEALASLLLLLHRQQEGSRSDNQQRLLHPPREVSLEPLRQRLLQVDYSANPLSNLRPVDSLASPLLLKPHPLPPSASVSRARPPLSRRR